MKRSMLCFAMSVLAMFFLIRDVEAAYWDCDVRVCGESGMYGFNFTIEIQADSRSRAVSKVENDYWKPRTQKSGLFGLSQGKKVLVCPKGYSRGDDYKGDRCQRTMCSVTCEKQ